LIHSSDSAKLPYREQIDWEYLIIELKMQIPCPTTYLPINTCIKKILLLIKAAGISIISIYESSKHPLSLQVSSKHTTH
jgi:hypothetical protein